MNSSSGSSAVNESVRQGATVVVRDSPFHMGSESMNYFAFALGSVVSLFIFLFIGLIVLGLVLFYLTLPYWLYKLNEELEEVKSKVLDEYEEED